MTDTDLTDETAEDVAANYLREAFLQGQHGPADDWRMWERAQGMAKAIERLAREQVAREIESGLPEARRRREDWIQRQQPDRVLGFTAAIDAIETCARIARGGA